MKQNKLTIIFFSLLVALAFTACNDDLLEKHPLDEVSSADFFKQPSDMEIYVNQFYTNALLPVYYGPVLGTKYRGGGDDFNSDNMIIGSLIDPRLMGSRTVGYEGRVRWDFSEVRSVNYFFDNYHKCESDFNSYKQYVGEAYFFRALIYFQLLQTFGDVPVVTKTLNTDSPELYEPRTPRNLVADRIIQDLDSAAFLMSDLKTDGVSRINKWMALAVQSRVALYEGTWEKYHANDDFKAQESNPEKYLRKAVEAATLVMNSGLFEIYSTGSPEKDYNDLFAQRDYSSNPEVLLWKKFSTALNINNNKNYQLEYPNDKSITKDLADAYLCKDGKPIKVSPSYQGDNTLMDEMQDRDPRFKQTIFTPEAPWMIDETSTIYWKDIYDQVNTNTKFNAPSGYVLRKGYDPRMEYHSLNYEETPSVVYRYAEVLLNYAEAKAELGELTQNDIDISVKKLRDRVGMPNLIISEIVSDPEWDFPSLSPVINEIRRERRVELASEGFRWDDIARWAAAAELIVGKRPKGAKANQFTDFYPVDEKGYLDPFKGSLPDGYRFDLKRDYLNPIPESQIVLNPNLKQNPGWQTN